jgi:hypothetical protein
MTSPVTDVVRRDPAAARAVLYDRLDLLQIERETNSTIPGFVESKRCKGGQREVDLVVEKYIRQASPGRGSGGGSRARVCVCYQLVFSFTHAYSKYTGRIIRQR